MSKKNIGLKLNADYGSEFSGFTSDFDAEEEKKFQKHLNDEAELRKKPYYPGLLNRQRETERMGRKRLAADICDAEEGKRMRYHQILTLDAYNRHKKFVNDYLELYGGSINDFKRNKSKDKSDLSVVYENHKFLWDEGEDVNWKQKVAKKYWDKLYKEYTICDLSLYKDNKVGFRWRTEKEVVCGKGQFSCSNKRCSEEDGLRSWEVNFSYVEAGERKQALVKSRLCSECSYMLNYHHKKKDVTGKSVGKKTKNSHKHKNQKEKKNKKSKKHKKHRKEKATSSSVQSDSSTEDDLIWKKPLSVEADKTREDEFDAYFSGMFM